MLPEELQTVRDKQEILDLLARYSRGIDRRDAELLASCYQPDATHDHGMFKGAASDFVEYGVDAVKSMDRTMHCLQHSVIEIRSASDAIGETACIAYHRVPSRETEGGWTDHTVGMRYLDRYERRARGPWLIAHRTIAWEWSRIDPVVREWNFSEGYTRGRRDENDAIYHFLGVERGATRPATLASPPS